MYAIIVVKIKQSGNTMAQHVILIAPEDIKKEPEDINIEQNRKWITAILIDAESTNASACNNQNFSIHWADWTGLLLLIIFWILLFVGYFGVFA